MQRTLDKMGENVIWPKSVEWCDFVYPEFTLKKHNVNVFNMSSAKEDNHTGREAGDPAKRSLNSVTRNV